MTKISASGLVVREQSVGEYDRLITVLTGKYGLVKAFCRGAKKSKSRKLSATALLTYSEFTFVKSKDAYTVEDAVSRECFFGLRNDCIKTSFAQYICELAYDFCEEDYESEEILRLFLNSLYFLNTGTKSVGFIKAVTELRLLSLSGYMPDLVACDVCSAYETELMYFVPESGKLYCAEHKPLSYCLSVSSSVVKAMRYITLSDFERIFFFSVSEETEKRLCEVSEKYLLHKSLRKYNTLEFLKMLSE